MGDGERRKAVVSPRFIGDFDCDSCFAQGQDASVARAIEGGALLLMNKGDFEISKLASLIIILLVLVLLLYFMLKIATVRDIFLRLFG